EKLRASRRTEGSRRKSMAITRTCIAPPFRAAFRARFMLLVSTFPRENLPAAATLCKISRAPLAPAGMAPARRWERCACAPRAEAFPSERGAAAPGAEEIVSALSIFLSRKADFHSTEYGAGRLTATLPASDGE